MATIGNVNVTPLMVRTLELLCDGCTNKEIARHCGVAEETIKARVCFLLRYYEARSRSHLAAIAVRSGVVA